MLKAEKSFLRTRVLSIYVGRLLRARFHSVRLEGVGDLHGLQRAAAPRVWFGNHHSWWDGLLEFRLAQLLGLDFHVMMEERNLAQFRFFMRTGAFGVDLRSPHGRTEGLLHAARLLRRGTDKTLLMLFPQGRFDPPVAPRRPFEKGLAGLRKLAPGAEFRPLAKIILPGNHPKAQVFRRLGPPCPADADTEALESALWTVWDALRDDLASGRPPRPGDKWTWVSAPPRRYRGQTA